MKTKLLLILLALVLIPSAFAYTEMNETVLNMSQINSTMTISGDCVWRFDAMTQAGEYLYVENLTVQNPDITEITTLNMTTAGVDYNCWTFPYTTSPSASASQCQGVKESFAKFSIALIPILVLIMGAVLILFLKNFDGSMAAINLVYAIAVAVGTAALIIAIIMLTLASMC